MKHASGTLFLIVASVVVSDLSYADPAPLVPETGCSRPMVGDKLTARKLFSLYTHTELAAVSAQENPQAWRVYTDSCRDYYKTHTKGLCTQSGGFYMEIQKCNGRVIRFRRFD